MPTDQEARLVYYKLQGSDWREQKRSHKGNVARRLTFLRVCEPANSWCVTRAGALSLGALYFMMGTGYISVLGWGRHVCVCVQAEIGRCSIIDEGSKVSRRGGGGVWECDTDGGRIFRHVGWIPGNLKWRHMTLHLTYKAWSYSNTLQFINYLLRRAHVNSAASDLQKTKNAIAMLRDRNIVIH